MSEIDAVVREQFCYLTTIGRKSGNPHTIEMWFAAPADRRVLYMLSGGHDTADWVRNIQQHPSVLVRIAGRTFSGIAREITDPVEDSLARKLVVSKYYGREEVGATGWEATSLPMAIDIEV